MTKKNQSIGKYIDINDLEEWENNPRINDQAVSKVARSIERFGFASPIIAKKAEKPPYQVLAGNTRLKASKQIGLKNVPVRFLDLSPTESELFAIADNKIGEIADWDQQLLKDILEVLPENDLEDIGFSINELDSLLEDLKTDDNKDDYIYKDHEIDVLKGYQPASKIGEVYKLGEHILVCGDCTLDRNWKKLENAVCFTSPPYSIGKNFLLSANKRDTIYISEEEEGGDYLNLLVEFTKSAIENTSQSFVNLQFLANNKISILEYLYEFRSYFCEILIWNKLTSQPAMAVNVCNSEFECIFVFSKYNNSRSIMFGDFRGTISNIISQPIQRNNDYSSKHQATMSRSFCDYIINSFCKKAEIIVDPFGGTGTTMISAQMNNKKSYLIEKEPLYCDFIRDRWFKFAIDNDLNIDDGIEVQK